MISQVPGSRVRLTGTSVSSRHVRLGSPKSLLAFLMMVWACRSQERVTSLLLLPLGEGERSFFWLLLPPVLPPSVSWLKESLAVCLPLTLETSAIRQTSQAIKSIVKKYSF